MKLAFSISKLWKFMLCPLKDKFISDFEIICLTAPNHCRNIGECNDSKNKQAFCINVELYSFCLFALFYSLENSCTNLLPKPK